jgi:hypothetical protein
MTDVYLLAKFVVITKQKGIIFPRGIIVEEPPTKRRKIEKNEKKAATILPMKKKRRRSTTKKLEKNLPLELVANIFKFMNVAVDIKSDQEIIPQLFGKKGRSDHPVQLFQNAKVIGEVKDTRLVNLVKNVTFDGSNHTTRKGYEARYLINDSTKTLDVTLCTILDCVCVKSALQVIKEKQELREKQFLPTENQLHSVTIRFKTQVLAATKAVIDMLPSEIHHLKIIGLEKYEKSKKRVWKELLVNLTQFKCLKSLVIDSYIGEFPQINTDHLTKLELYFKKDVRSRLKYLFIPNVTDLYLEQQFNRDSFLEDVVRVLQHNKTKFGFYTVERLAIKHKNMDIGIFSRFLPKSVKHLSIVCENEELGSRKFISANKIVPLFYMAGYHLESFETASTNQKPEHNLQMVSLIAKWQPKLKQLTLRNITFDRAFVERLHKAFPRLKEFVARESVITKEGIEQIIHTKIKFTVMKCDLDSTPYIRGLITGLRMDIIE